ncbi:hypothetical protein Lesp02_54910 [Lentzea sp. NBRC 105346]|nr:hypothetical protein Lesp02_54910 [Lentzea sp. NBRC 105346]
MRWLIAVLFAVVVTIGTGTGILLWDKGASKIEVIKTAGVAGGAVVAIYALWLNDRRRRLEEARHDLESVRHGLESEKVADERFARSVELLGNEADQVRVGAMHALAWLANSTPRYKQTVLDVLCAYLRRPFWHPVYAHGSDPDRHHDGNVHEEDHERQVRLTAQRLITDLLPWGDDRHDGPAYDLDLSGASLEYLRLEGRRIGWLTARRAQFYGYSRFRELHTCRPALFSGATFHGRLQLGKAELMGGVSFQEVTFGREAEWNGAKVGTFLHPSDEPPAEQIGELEILPDTDFRRDVTGWALTGSTDPAGLGFKNYVHKSGGGRADGIARDDDGLRDGYLPTETDEVGAGGLDRKRLWDKGDAKSEADEVQQ